jgi:hypothetical protein
MSNPLLRLFGMDQNLVRGQDASDAAFRQADPVEVDADLTTSPTDVAHKLGRIPQGFTVVSNPSGLSVLQSDSAFPDLFLRLACSSGSGTVRIQVY